MVLLQNGISIFLTDLSFSTPYDTHLGIENQAFLFVTNLWVSKTTNKAINTDYRDRNMRGHTSSSQHEQQNPNKQHNGSKKQIFFQMCTFSLIDTTAL